MATTFAGSMYPELNVEATDEEKEEEDSAETGSTTSFSLQECINEFRARRIRRVSTHSRDCEMLPPSQHSVVAQSSAPAAAEAHLINQNRSNKAQERKSKPCENGFCYCFTSDSGDCASTAPPPRDWHVRHNKRSRRSENNKFSAAQRPANNLNAQQCGTRRQTLPAQGKQQSVRTSSTTCPLTAVSSLHAVGDDAPLIHIIQELRDNCVVSEVRVNRDKLSNTARHALTSTTSAKMEKPLPKLKKTECIEYQPTAPVLSHISEQESQLEQSDNLNTTATSLADTSLKSTRRSSRRNSSGGRLLRKRLSEGLVNFKTRDTQQPPPKPPRRSAQSLESKFSQSSLTSTTPSVREAERVLDEFLRKHGVEVPTSNKEQQLLKPKTNRKSFPLAEREKPIRDAPMPTCPSLSDIERVVESKRGVHYAKNIHMASRKTAVSEKPMKEIVIGWTEPKINDMLNYDTAKHTQFKTHAPAAAPQVVNVGWQNPVVPKMSLDTVDGVSENLAVNIDQKHTPIKYPRLNASKKSSQKFIWGEQWRNLSWNGNHNRTGLRTKSKKFLNNSKNKILRFVSPKKSNQPDCVERPKHTPRLCTVGVQTSTSQLDLQSQSPPGSYHSPVQSTPTASTTRSSRQHQYKDSSEQEQLFDFQRKVAAPTPPKKWPRAQRARKLNFQDHGNPTATTYRSYHKDLDQDVTITKMGYLLSSIRAKLEASDEHAVRTFRECSRFVPEEQSVLSSNGFDCNDGPSSRTRRSTTVRVQNCDSGREPIYSEIEEDCMHISGSPQFDVRTEAQLIVAPTTTPTASPTRTATITATSIISESSAMPSPSSSSYTPVTDPNELYAKVIKVNKAAAMATHTRTAAAPRPLGQFLQESLLNGSIFQFMPLPDEPCSDTSYTRSSLKSLNRASEQPTLPLHQSLNNINEQHSPPKKNRNLSKSNLSLQRSEIFLENLCRSEIVLDQDANVRLEKVENTCLRAYNAAAGDTDNVSYDMPHEVYDDYGINEVNASGHWLEANANSQYGSVQIEPPPPSSDNQSTPKKQTQRYTTKPPPNLSIDLNAAPTLSVRAENLIHSCPTTPQQVPDHVKPAHSSLDELAQRQTSESHLLSVSTLARYRLLKAALRRSYRKGKDFFVAEKQKLAYSLSISRDQSNQTEGELESSSYYASFNVDSLLNESLPFNEQLAQAVSICRQMPELEISPEMVEAERLLLFSSLRQKTAPAAASENFGTTLAAKQQSQCFLLDGLRLPVKADVSQDMFFNYYYICTIEFDGRIRSTQSIECRHGAAVFRDCGLEFYSSSPAETLQLRCKIFMLRLRKVSTLSLEPAKTLLQRGSGNLGSASSSNSSQCEQIISRFRLHASFTLSVTELVPYEQVFSDAQPSDKLWLRSSSSWQLPLTTHTKYSNLMPQIEVNGRVDLRLPKIQYAGYLNVQDTQPNNKHNWNRRWCTLDGVSLSVWQHEQNLSEQPPLLALHLEHCQQSELVVASGELCARARSFLLQCGKVEACFAADTQPELVDWLLHLNEALAFARRWLSTG